MPRRAGLQAYRAVIALFSLLYSVYSPIYSDQGAGSRGPGLVLHSHGYVWQAAALGSEQSWAWLLLAGCFLRFLARCARCCALSFSATVARRIYLCPGMGVGALSRYFGGVDNKSTTRQHARRGARGVLRHILIQMESNGLMETNNMETAEYVPTIHVL